jgi:peptide/nickel transport system permease protein
VTRLILNRILQAAAVIAVVATSVFVLLQFAPGDPFAASLDGTDVPPGVRAEWRARYGFDLPPAERFTRWAGALAHGQLGYAPSQHRVVSAVLAEAMPRTLLLTGDRVCTGRFPRTAAGATSRPVAGSRDWCAHAGGRGDA